MLKKLVVLAALLSPLPSMAEIARPQPPCGATPYPVSSAVAGGPSVGVWSGADLRKAGWQPPVCLGWTGDSRFVVALAGDIAWREPADQLLARLTMFSVYPSIKYWSTTQKEWLPLAQEAGALNGLNLQQGQESSYFERNAGSGKTTYRLRVLERSESRIVMATENVTPISVAIVTAFEPGALQSVSFLEKRGTGVWSFYQITRAGMASSSMISGRENSFVNRLAALYRHMAGIQTDLEPPVAR